MSCYYNEFDPKAAAWLRELIAKNLIAPGDVDERSITELKPDDLDGYTQCHFFAGVGVWSYALRRAGWSDELPVWTGSCPCQPFSAAGAKKGIDDERHLWPTFCELIKSCRPRVVLGEQVASADVIGKVKHVYAGKGSTAWLDVVLTDLENAHYTSGAVVAPSAGVGAPHNRQRIWWMAHTSSVRRQQQSNKPRGDGAGVESQGREQELASEAVSDALRMGYTCVEPRERNAGELSEAKGEAGGKRRSDGNDDHGYSDASEVVMPNPCNGFWSDPDWLWCRDEKWRPVKSGLEPLVDGPASRVVSGGNSGEPVNAEKTSEARAMRLRGYGNAINAESAKVFVECVMDVLQLDELILSGDNL